MYMKCISLSKITVLPEGRLLAYSHDAFIELETQIKEIMIAVGRRRSCKSKCQNSKKFWKIFEHLDDSPTCRKGYSAEEYDTLIDLDRHYDSNKKLEIAKAGKIMCKGCLCGFDYWEIFKHVNQKGSYCRSKYNRFRDSVYYIHLWNTVVLTRDRKAHYSGSNIASTLNDFVTDSYEEKKENRLMAWKQLESNLEEHRDGPQWPDELKY